MGRVRRLPPRPRDGGLARPQRGVPRAARHGDAVVQLHRHQLLLHHQPALLRLRRARDLLGASPTPAEADWPHEAGAGGGAGLRPPDGVLERSDRRTSRPSRAALTSVPPAPPPSFVPTEDLAAQRRAQHPRRHDRRHALGRAPVHARTCASTSTSRGLLFRNSFAPNPLCCPSRASFLIGQYSHNHRVYSHEVPYGFAAFDDHLTVGTALNQAGYQTALVGKYLNGYGKQPSRGDRRAVGDLRAGRLDRLDGQHREALAGRVAVPRRHLQLPVLHPERERQGRRQPRHLLLGGGRRRRCGR